MRLKRRLHLIISGIILLTMYIVMILSLANKINFIDTSTIMYSIIIFMNLNTLISLFIYRRKEYSLVLSFIAILCADYFLLYGNDNTYFIGVLFFTAVQFLYNYHLFKNKYTLKFIIGYLVLSTIISIIVSITKMGDALLFGVTGAYFILQVTNIVLTIINFKKLNKPYFMLLGMILLMLCDINVGLSFLCYEPIFNFVIWLYYVPHLYLVFVESVGNRCLKENG